MATLNLLDKQEKIKFDRFVMMFILDYKKLELYAINTKPYEFVDFCKKQLYNVKNKK